MSLSSGAGYKGAGFQISARTRRTAPPRRPCESYRSFARRITSLVVVSSRAATRDRGEAVVWTSRRPSRPGQGAERRGRCGLGRNSSEDLTSMRVGAWGHSTLGIGRQRRKRRDSGRNKRRSPRTEPGPKDCCRLDLEAPGRGRNEGGRRGPGRNLTSTAVCS